MINFNWAELAIFGLFGLIFLVTLIALAIFLITNRYYKYTLETLRYNVSMATPMSEYDLIPKLLDNFIDGCFTDYQIKELINIDDEFINAEKEEKIRKDLASIVVTRLSPSIIDKLSLIYNPATIDIVIADKIYITVMNYVIEHNLNFNNQ